MVTAVGIVALAVGLIAWIGQGLSFLSPTLAVRLGVLEPAEEIDPTLRVVESRAMGLTDLALAWTLPAAALLMLMKHSAWPYLALVGAGVYLYFSLMIVLNRVFLRREGVNAGRPASVTAAYVFGVVWAATAAAMLLLALESLTGSGV